MKKTLMERRSLFCFIIVLVSGGILAPISELTQARSTTIEDLPNGIYLFCDQPNLYNNERQAMCFQFRKTENRVVGDFFPDRSDFEDICIEGIVNNNTVSGQALESLFPVDEPVTSYLPGAQGSKFVNWDSRGYLRVRRERVIIPFRDNDAWVRYESALLDLKSFYQHKPLPHPIPTNSCQIIQQS